MCLLCGCNAAPETPDIEPTSLSENEDVSISYHTTNYENVYGITLTNHLKEPIYFWANASVEKLVNNEWVEIPEQQANSDSDQATLLEADSSKDTLLPFNTRYGEMENGHYRIRYAYALENDAKVEDRSWLSLECDLEFQPMTVALTTEDMQKLIDEKITPEQKNDYKIIEPIKYPNGWHYHFDDYQIEIITELELKDVYVMQYGEKNTGHIGIYAYEEKINEDGSTIIFFDSLIELVNVTQEAMDACNQSNKEEGFCKMDSLFMKQDATYIANRTKLAVNLNAKQMEIMRSNQCVAENGKFPIFDKIIIKDYVPNSED